MNNLHSLYIKVTKFVDFVVEGEQTVNVTSRYRNERAFKFKLT